MYRVDLVPGALGFSPGLSCKVTSKMRAYQATQRLGRSYNTKTKEYSD